MTSRVKPLLWAYAKPLLALVQAATTFSKPPAFCANTDQCFEEGSMCLHLCQHRRISLSASQVPQQQPEVPPPPLYKLRPCPSYSRRRDRINLGPTFNSVPNVVQPHKTWVW